MSTQNFKPTLLIWSKDRACQLDLLLTSLDVFCPKQFTTYVIYKYSNDEFLDGYLKCQDYHPYVRFHYETDFREQTLEIMSGAEYLAISTDDTIIHHPFSLKQEYMKGVDIFSMRLGLNTTVQEPFSKRVQPALTKYTDEGGTVVWDSRLYHPHNNYGYQFGMDMVLYSRKYYELVKEIPFKRTNDIEGFLSTHCRNKINPFIRSFKHSVACNIPGNNLSGVTKTDNSMDFESLNKQFLDGYTFSLKEIEETKFVGAHQLVSLRME